MNTTNNYKSILFSLQELKRKNTDSNNAKLIDKEIERLQNLLRISTSEENPFKNYEIQKENTEENNFRLSIDRKSSEKINDKNQDMTSSLDLKNVGLSNKSKFMIQLRIILLILLCIYIPIEIVFSEKFILFENKNIFNYIIIYFPASLQDNQLYLLASKIYMFILGDKDMIMVYSLLIYISYHPFTAYKIIFVTHFLEFINVILRMLYKSGRPFWYDQIKTVSCLTSFASPSLSYYLVTFFYFYTSILFISEKKKFYNKQINGEKGYKMSTFKKILFFLFTLIFTSIYGLFLMINRLNFLYQICLANVFTLTSIFICLDIESHIHNSIFKSLKNIFKIRKNKIQILMFTIFINLLGVIVYNLIDHDINNNVIYQNLSTIDDCKDKLNNFGIKMTFLDSAYIYGIIGAFFGIALTVEEKCGVWWEGNLKNKTIKIFISFVFGLSYIILFRLYESPSFEFDYFLSIIKYILFYYLSLGCLPLLFEKLKLNKSQFTKYISRMSRLSQAMTNYQNHNLLDEIKKKDFNIFKNTNIIGGVDPKTLHNNLEFLIVNNNYEDEVKEIIQEKDDE